MLSVKGISITAGLIGGLWVGWSVLMAVVGIGNVPFDFFDQIYLGWLQPTYGGLVLGIVLGFIDGFVGGLIFTNIYNLFAKKGCCK